jgi:hypothetical protein
VNYASQHIPPEGVARGMTRFKLRIFAIVVPQWLGYHHPTSIAMDEHGSHKIKGVVPYLTPSAHDSGAACVQLRWVRSAESKVGGAIGPGGQALHNIPSVELCI